jgi:Glycosyltransferase family 87
VTNPNETTSTRPRGGTHWRGRGIILLIAVAASAWALWFLTTRSLERQVIWTDYALFHATVNRWLDGQAMYGRGIPMVGAPRITESVNFNPPQFHVLVLPLARLGLRPGLLLWQALSIAAGLFCAVVVVRTLQLRFAAMPAAIATALVLNSAALSSTMWFGQISLFLAVPVTLAWRARRLGRWNDVARWMGLAASIKPFLLIVFPYILLARQWRAVIWGGATWALSFAVGILVFGPEALTQWFEAARWPTWVVHFQNASFHGYVARVMWEFPGPLVASIGAAAGIAITIWLAHTRDADAGWALLMAGALLWAPLGWIYYGWFVMPPLAALAAERRLPRVAWLLVLPLVWPIAASTGRLTGTGLDFPLRSIYFWGLLGLWLLLCSSAVLRRPAPVAAR